VKPARHALVLLLLGLSAVASAGILYDFEQAFFVEDFGVKCKDHTLARDDSLFHLFYIQGYSDGPVPPLGFEQWLGHVTSPDLRHWTRRDSILPVVPGSWENGFIWAPHIMADPAGGWVMAYTGADTSAVVRQRTGLAWSGDLYDWQRYEFNPVHEPDSWTDWSDPIYEYANCRDPFLFQVPGDSLYYMLNTVRKADGGGAIDLSVSEDLYNWAPSDTFMHHSSANMIESISLWEDDAGKWHAFYTQQNHSGTYHTFADSPFGPFWPGAGVVFDPGYGAEVTVIDSVSYFSRYAKVALSPGSRYFIRFDELRSPMFNGDWPLLSSLQGLQSWWTPQFGTAFDSQPTWGDNPVERGEPSSHMEGNSYLSTLELYPYPGYSNPGRSQGTGPTGLLKSDDFVVAGDRIGLLVGGGDQDSTCFVALVRKSDGRLLFRETGADANGMDPRLWNTGSLLGETVFLVVADLSSLDWGWISTDSIHEYIRTGDDPMPPTDPLQAEIHLGDLLSAAGIQWNCDFSASTTFGAVPLYVVFTNETEGAAALYEWDLENDGIVDRTTRDVAHSYQTPGLYSVNLHVVNDLGMEADCLKENYILVLENETNVLAFPGEYGNGLPMPIAFGYSGPDSLSGFSAAVSFDSTCLAYGGLQSWLPGIDFQDSLAGEKVFIDWQDPGGVNPIDPNEDPLFMFGLVFTPLVATDTTQVGFIDSLCLLRSASGDTIQNMGWVDDPPFGRVILNVTCQVTGTTEYYDPPNPLPGVVLSMGPPNPDAVSNAWGEFEFEPYPMGDYLLRPSKLDGLECSNSLDAVKILRHAAGLEILEGSDRLRAADVNLDGAVDSLDATSLVEAAVGLGAMPSGDWVFEPDSILFQPLNMDEDVQVRGIRMGDVNSDWVSDSGSGPYKPRAGERSAVSLSLPDTTLNEGTTDFQVAMLAAGLDSLSAITLRVAFADSLLQFMGIESRQPGLQPLAGDGDGRIRIEWFDPSGGDSLFSQQGDTLLLLDFSILRTEWSVSPLDFLVVSALGDSIGDAIGGVLMVDGSVTMPGHGVGADPPPPSFGLGQNFPNPFNPTTRIRFSLAADSPTSLGIYDLQGRLLRQLLAETRMEAGEHEVKWDGRDRRGRSLPSGVYFYRLDCGDFTDSRKMLLIK